MTIYPPGTFPVELRAYLSSEFISKVDFCYVSVADDGMCFYSVFPDHLMILGIVGTGTKACLALLPYFRSDIAIYFVGHTAHVIEWGKKSFEPVGVLYQYKRKKRKERSCPQ